MPIEILMPALSPTMTEGNLSKWFKKEGDAIKSGEVIAEIETDKATMEVEAVDEGILGKILVPEGSENVAVNALIALVLTEGENPSSLDNFSSKAKNEISNETKVNVELEVKEEHKVSSKNDSNRIIASPLAKRIAANLGVDLANISGTGPYGRIVKSDVEGFKGNNPKPVTPQTTAIFGRNSESFIRIPNNNMRKVIAKRLCESKQTVPHFYLNIECNLDKLLKLRTELNSISIGENVVNKISVNDFVIKAVASALKHVPSANASWSDEAILQYNNVDISVAVAIDGGLITPIIKNADHKSVTHISNEMKELASRAKLGKLAPEEFQGGGFSISNLGMFGIKNFNAIINPPQSCILAIGAGSKRTIVIDDNITIATIMDVTLSSDHRVVDGAIGAEFLSMFKKFIENPILMLV